MLGAPFDFASLVGARINVQECVQEVFWPGQLFFAASDENNCHNKQKGISMGHFESTKGSWHLLPLLVGFGLSPSSLSLQPRCMSHGLGATAGHVPVMLHHPDLAGHGAPSPGPSAPPSPDVLSITLGKGFFLTHLFPHGFPRDDLNKH